MISRVVAKIGVPGKKYGLQVPTPEFFAAAGTAEEEGVDEAAEAARATKNAADRRARADAAEQARALAEDPTVYEYDSLFDSMHAAKQGARRPAAEIEERKARYVPALQKMADRRKKFLDVAFDKKLQREAERERQEFGETEKYVTDAYRLRLEEDKEWEEEEDERAKEAGDGAKDMSEFHANMIEDLAAARAGVEAKERPRPKAAPLVGGAPPPREEKRDTMATRRIAEEEREGEEERTRREKRIRETKEEMRIAQEQREEKAKKKEEETKAKLARKTTGDSVSSARERFLARKALTEKELKEARERSATEGRRK